MQPVVATLPGCGPLLIVGIALGIGLEFLAFHGLASAVGGPAALMIMLAKSTLGVLLIGTLTRRMLWEAMRRGPQVIAGREAVQGLLLGLATALVAAPGLVLGTLALPLFLPPVRRALARRMAPDEADEGVVTLDPEEWREGPEGADPPAERRLSPPRNP